MDNGQRPVVQRGSPELTTLVHVMQSNPNCWDQQSVATILDDLEVLAAPELPEMVLFRTKRVQRELILPLADIVATQSKTITAERRRFAERERKLKTTVASLEAEKSESIRLYKEEAARLAQHSQFCDMLLGDLDEMAKTLDRTRLEKKQADGKLVELQAEKEQAEERLAQLDTEVKRLIHGQQGFIGKSTTPEQAGDFIGLGPKICDDLTTDTHLRLDENQVCRPEGGTESTTNAADEEGHSEAARAAPLTSDKATQTVSSLDDYSASKKFDSDSHGASVRDEGTPGIADPSPVEEAEGMVIWPDVVESSRATYLLTSSGMQPREYRSEEIPYENASMLEQVAVVVLEEGATSMRIVLDSGLSSAPQALQHFCKSLCTRTVIGISAAILSVVKHSPLGFAFHMY